MSIRNVLADPRLELPRKHASDYHAVAGILYLVCLLGVLSCQACLSTTTLPAMGSLRGPPQIRPGDAISDTTLDTETQLKINEINDFFVDYAEFSDLCEKRRFGIEVKFVAAKGRETKGKTIVGAIAGGLTTLGGLTTGVTAAGIEDQGENAGKGKDEPLWAGIATAAVGTLGTVAIILITPGAETQQLMKDEATRTNQAITGVNDFIAQHDEFPWADEVMGQWKSLIAQKKAICNLEIPDSD